MKTDNKYDVLKLENQLCFPLYAVAREIVKKYHTYLSEIDLTYTQYITMMVLWSEGQSYVKDLGEKLYLDSGTLTPVLNALEKKGLVIKKRSETDKRDVLVTLTKSGEQLKEKAVDIPLNVSNCIPLEKDDAKELYRILKSILNNI